MKKIIITESQLNSLYGKVHNLEEGVFDDMMAKGGEVIDSMGNVVRGVGKSFSNMVSPFMTKSDKKLRTIGILWSKLDKSDGRVKGVKGVYNNMSWLDIVKKFRITQDDLDKAIKMVQSTKPAPVENPKRVMTPEMIADKVMKTADMSLITDEEKLKFSKNNFLSNPELVKEFQLLINKITKQETLTSGTYDTPTYEILKIYRRKEREIPKPTTPIVKDSENQQPEPGTVTSASPTTSNKALQESIDSIIYRIRL